MHLWLGKWNQFNWLNCFHCWPWICGIFRPVFVSNLWKVWLKKRKQHYQATKKKCKAKVCSCELRNSSAEDILQIQEIAGFNGNVHLSLHRRLFKGFQKLLSKQEEETSLGEGYGLHVTVWCFLPDLFKLPCVPTGSWKPDIKLKTEQHFFLFRGPVCGMILCQLMISPWKGPAFLYVWFWGFCKVDGLCNFFYYFFFNFIASMYLWF